MNIRKLEWDSNFFGLRIGRADIQTKEEAEELASKVNLLKKEYDLLYVFDENHVGFKAKNSHLVDEKVLYSKPCEPKQAFEEISIYERKTPSNSLYHLAHISGGYSRFKLDNRFPRGSFERLYNRWIENACPQNGSNKHIFEYSIEGIAKGMITVDYAESGLAHIGLVSIDDNCQHRGIGTKIMSTVENYLYQLGYIHTLEVPTQKTNTDACRWYEKNGFKIKSIVDIYHWWL